MKNVLIVIAVILLFVWIVSWFRTPAAVASAASKSWPGNLGTLDSVASRYPRVKASEASMKLMTLATTLPRSKAIDDFVAREIARGEMAIDEPPAVPDLSAIRDLLLRGNITWGQRWRIGDDKTTALRATQMNAARVLIASALTKARAQDGASWDDLHAVWNLARSFDGHPQVMMQTAAMSMVRMINAVAWKMPLPAPAWLSDLEQRDEVLPLLEAFQAQTRSYAETGPARVFPTKFIADSVENDRRIAEALFIETRCDVTARMNVLGTDLSAVWRRAFRYRAEREATSNALRIREGKMVEPASRCSDGSWTFDGTTLRFTREIPTAPPDKPMPLALRVLPASGSLIALSVSGSTTTHVRRTNESSRMVQR